VICTVAREQAKVSCQLCGFIPVYWNQSCEAETVASKGVLPEHQGLQMLRLYHVCMLFTFGVWRVMSLIIMPQHLCTCVDEIVQSAFSTI
jgi:hypothetical protein